MQSSSTRNWAREPSDESRSRATGPPNCGWLFDQSRLDREPAKWVVLGNLRLVLKGGGNEVYTIFLTRKDPGAYADHLGRYFRGGSDAAFLEFLAKGAKAAKPPAETAPPR